MRIAILGFLAALTLGFNSGCSYLSIKKTQRELATARIMRSGDRVAIDGIKMGADPASAIKIVQLDNNGIGIGIDLLSEEVLTTNTWRHLAAIALDGLAIYYGNKAIQDYTRQDVAPATTSVERPDVNVSINVTISNTKYISVLADDDFSSPTPDCH